jgi:hypothetical protein
MRSWTRFAPLCAALLLISAPLHAAQITGDYVEARSADVYTGPCFSNSEAGLTGNLATVAWRVNQGEWNGTVLDGLAVVAVARANATLGDPFGNPYPAKAVLIVDSRATEDQKCALVEFAQAMGGKLIENVVAVQSAPISLEVGGGSAHGAVKLEAGNLARIQTRSLGDKDHFCGNEEVAYEPLSEKLTHAMAAFTLADEFQGQGLGVAWKNFGKRSAFVGTFAR